MSQYYNSHQMNNRFGIPQEVLSKIRERDVDCVYCHKKMIYPYANKNRIDSATIEHLNHKQDWNSVESYIQDGLPVDEIIVICCGSCNSSRGSKSLREWFDSSFCRLKDINYESVAIVVRKYFDKYE